MVMGVMMDRKVSLSSLASEVKIYPQLLKNVRVADKQAVKENAAVQEAVTAVTVLLEKTEEFSCVRAALSR